MQQKCIVFGCGNVGKSSYYKLNKIYDIVAYTDNNENLWGKKIYDTKIISPNDLAKEYGRKPVSIAIAVDNYKAIYYQLKEMGFYDIFVIKMGLIYKIDDNGILYPTHDLYTHSSTCKKKNNLKILFVQNSPCIRTNKIAKMLKDVGIEVGLAYLNMKVELKNQIGEKLYDYTYPIYSIQKFIDFVNSSDINLIHSSNEPDYLTVLLTNTNKTVIHDCHDLSSVYKSMSPSEMAIEYIANAKSQGVIHATERLREIACKNFKTDKRKTFVLENLISEELQPTKYLPKLSSKDGRLHCVYEGAIVGTNKTSYRYFEKIWEKITRCGIHIHFYAPAEEEYCKLLETKSEYLHYEGNYSSKQLSIEMTKYDVGLCLFNITELNRQYLESTSPNKIQEYVNAGIPVAVNNIKNLVNYVEGHNFGKELRLSDDIERQLTEISKLKIPERILQTKELTLESKRARLISFYKECLVN